MISLLKNHTGIHHRIFVCQARPSFRKRIKGPKLLVFLLSSMRRMRMEEHNLPWKYPAEILIRWFKMKSDTRDACS